MKLILIFIVILFSGCSSKKEPNIWEHNSALSSQSYSKYFLQGSDVLAQAEYKRAVKNAKQSASLETLAKVYLLKCALNQAVAIEDDCSQYLEIEPLTKDLSTKAYYAFIKEKVFEYRDLPKQYRDFASSLDIRQKREALFKIDSVVSQLIAASLIKDSLNDEEILKLLDKSSYYGYKRANIMLLKYLASSTKNEKLKKESLLKIEILLN